MRRKQMRRIVRSVFDVGPDEAEALLVAADIEPDARPEVLEVDRFVALLRATGPAGQR
jgi:16S rRNA A1518/A1519 N6-dimethyltransferase RsmA/KsgA/DIM1 with predicted DNA glycosylase/AP lyase activity